MFSSYSAHIYTMDDFIAYGNRFHINTVIDITVNFFAAYIVLKHSTKAMGACKYYILLTIICAFLMDFHLSFIFAPFLMLPAPLYCGAGAICRHLDHFWEQYIQYFIMGSTINSVRWSVVFGLFYQLSSLNGNVEFFHSFKGITIMLFTMIFYPLPSFSLVIPMQDFDESAAFVKQFYNNSYDLFITAPSCHGLKLEMKTVIHLGALATQIILVWAIGISVIIRIHRKLSSMKNILSSATLKARRQLLIALCFQMTVPSALIVVPLVLILMSMIIDAKYFVIVNEIAFPIMAFHSLANACSILYIITPFRTAIVTGIKRIFDIKAKTVQSIVETTINASPQRNT